MFFEQLEQRTVLTTNIYIDFGDNLPFTGVSMTGLQLRDTFANGGIQGPDLRFAIADTATFTVGSLRALITFDYNQDGTVNSTDYFDLRTNIVSMVQRIFEPYDVNVQIAPLIDATSSTTYRNGIINTLQAGVNAPTPHFDTWVFCMPANVGATRLGDLISSGIARGTDINGFNNTADSSFVFADYMLTNGFNFSNGTTPRSTAADSALANNIAHEAGHNLGFKHAFNTQGGRVNILNNSEYMGYGVDWAQIGFNTRFNILSDYVDTTFTQPGEVINYHARAVRNLGRRPGGAEFVTGTGANDTITITKSGANTATVTVRAFSDAAHLVAVPIPGGDGVFVGDDGVTYTVTGGSTFSYTINTSAGITIDGGELNDWFVIDGDLGNTIRIRGGDMTDRITIVGKNALSGSYTTGATRVNSGINVNTDKSLVENLGGTLQLNYAAGLTTQIIFQDMERPNLAGNAGYIELGNVGDFTFNTGASVDDVTLETFAPGVVQIRGTSSPVGNTLDFVPIRLTSLTNLTISTGTNDLANGGDTVSVLNPLSPAVMQSLSIVTRGGNDTVNLVGVTLSNVPIIVNMGSGTDTLNVSEPGGTNFNVRSNGGGEFGALTQGTFAQVETINGNASAADTFNIFTGGFIQSLNGLGTFAGTGRDELRIQSVAGGTSRTTVTGVGIGSGPSAVLLNNVAAVGSFAGIEAIYGNAGADTFAFSATGSLSSGILGQGGEDTLDLSGLGGAISLDLNGVDQGNVTRGATNFLATGAVSAAFANPFTSVENVIGTGFSDTFAFSTGDRLTGTIGVDGGAQSSNNPGDVISTNYVSGTVYNVTGPNGTGDFTNPAVGPTPANRFRNIESLNGAANVVDTFNLSATGFVQNINGGGPNPGPLDVLNILTVAGQAATVTVSALNAGSASTSAGGGIGSFTGIELINTGAGDDTFAFDNGGRLSSGVNGQGGNDTLEVRETAGSAFDVLGSNTGDVYVATGASPFGRGRSTTKIVNIDGLSAVGYQSIENLRGGGGDDVFEFLNAGDTHVGWIDGGGGNDFVNLANQAPVLFAVTGAGSIDGYNGRIDNVGGAATTGVLSGGSTNEFRNIDSVLTNAAAGDVFENATGDTGRFRIADDAAVAGNDRDSQFLLDGAADAFDFRDFETVRGGSAADIFGVVSLAPSATARITLDGGGGNDRFYVGTPFDIETQNVEDVYDTGSGSLDTLLSRATIVGGSGVDQVFADDSGETSPFWYDVTDQFIRVSSRTTDSKGNPTNTLVGPGSRPFAGLVYNRAGYNVEGVKLAGSQGANNFYVTPGRAAADSAANVRIDVDGNDPDPTSNAKDFIAVNFAGTTVKRLVNYDPSTGTGTWTFGNAGPVNFANIELVSYFQVLAAASDVGQFGSGEIRVYDPDTGELLSAGAINAFPGYKGGVRVATGDLNGDGIPEIVATPGFGTNPLVRVFDLVKATSAATIGSSLITEFNGLPSTETGRGLSVAVGDINGDGAGDIIVGATFGASTVRVFNGSRGAVNISATPSIDIANVFPETFTGGVWVAAGNVINNAAVDPVGGKRDEVLVAMGNGALAGTGSQVRILAADTSAANSLAWRGTINALQGYRHGAFVTTAALPGTDNRVAIVVSMQKGSTSSYLTSRDATASLANGPGGVVEVYSPINAATFNYWATPAFRFQPFPGPATDQASHAGTRVQARLVPDNAAAPAAGGVDRRIEFFATQGQDGRPTNGKAVTRWYGVLNSAGRLVNVTASADAVFANLAINMPGTKPKPGGTSTGLFLG